VIALANGTGPFIGGALVDSVSWRWLFWIIPMLTLPAFLLILFFLPLKYTSSNTSSKLRKIDYIGIVLNIAAVLLILIPLSSGGVQYAWDSAIVITMLVIGVATAVLFILYEWKIAPMPILPVHLVSNPHCPALYIQNFFTGICYFGNFFYTPIYFQSVRGYSALISGALLLVIIIPTGFTSILSGQMMTRTGRYRWVMVVGFVLWTLGTSLKCAFDRETEVWYAVLVLAVEGLGIGMTQQPPLLAILSNSSQSERAVATGLRYFIRTVGGAFGIIISGAILSNNLESQLSGLDFITPEILKTLTYSTYSLNKLGFTYTQKDEVLASYMTGMKYIFILFAACSGLNLLLCAGIGNTDLKAKKFMVEEKDKDMVSIRNVTPEPFQEPTQKDEESWEEKVNKE
jgi:MFS family permease